MEHQCAHGWLLMRVLSPAEESVGKKENREGTRPKRVCPVWKWPRHLYSIENYSIYDGVFPETSNCGQQTNGKD